MGKIAGEYLPRWLTEHGVVPAARRQNRRRKVAWRSAARCASLRGAEAQYLYDLRSADGGRRMAENAAGLSVGRLGLGVGGWGLSVGRLG